MSNKSFLQYADLFIEDKTFDKINFTVDVLLKGTYENCLFSTCDFSNADLSNIKFTFCRFNHCNLTLALLGNTSFKEVKFINSKILGLRFDHSRTMAFEIDADNCILNHGLFTM